MKTWYMSINIMVIIFTKKYFSFLINIADIAIWMSDFDNFDIDQMSSKFAQR